MDAEKEQTERAAIKMADMKWPQDSPHSLEEAKIKVELVSVAWQRMYDSLPEAVKEILKEEVA